LNTIGTLQKASPRWDDAVAYERYIGRWSRPVAREFVAWLSAPASARWLDAGCGSGALSQAILAVAAPGDVTGIDLSEDYVAYVARQVRDPRAHFSVGDAQGLRYPNNWFDAAASGLVLNFVPDKGRMIRELARVVVSGGIAGLYVWDYAGEMQMLRIFWDAAGALDPAVLELDEGRRFPVCRPGTLEDLSASAGLVAVTTRSIDVKTHFHNFDDFWQPFLGGQGPAPSYVKSLDEELRAALRNSIRARLPIAADGSIDLIARAWAVKGIVP
jgi:SAM-dependent methyltransferase